MVPIAPSCKVAVNVASPILMTKHGYVRGQTTKTNSYNSIVVSPVQVSGEERFKDIFFRILPPSSTEI